MMRSGNLEAVRDLAGQAIPPGDDAAALRLRVESAWWLHRIGMTRTALTHIQSIKSEDGLALSALGWALAEMGDYEDACRIALDAINRDTVHDAASRRYRLLRARFTKPSCEAEPTPMAGRLWAELAAVRGDLDGAEALVTRSAAESGLGATSLEWLLADVRMALLSGEQWQDARTRYEDLLTRDATSSLDRADILLNLAVIHDHMRKRELAIAKLRSAIEANPLHEPARDRLESFGADVA